MAPISDHKFILSGQGEGGLKVGQLGKFKRFGMGGAWLKSVRAGFDYQACNATAFAEKKRGYVKAFRRSEMDEDSGHPYRGSLSA